MPVNYSGIFAPTRSLRISCIIILIKDDYKSKFALSFRLLQFQCANHTVAVPLQWPEERPTSIRSTRRDHVHMSLCNASCGHCCTISPNTNSSACESKGSGVPMISTTVVRNSPPKSEGQGLVVSLWSYKRTNYFYSFQFIFLESNSKNGVNHYIGEILLSLPQAFVCMSYKNLLH